MRALVTGAAGFVGSHLVEALLARGDSVVGVDCFTPYYDRIDKEENVAAAFAHDEFELIEADLRTADIAELLIGVDAVFHQAAQAGVRLSWSAGFADYVGHNVLATQRLLEAVHSARPSARVVYASSSSVYGNQARYPTTETDLPRPFSPYGVTKLGAEHLCNLYAENWALHTMSLRYFTVFGPRQRPDMSIHRLCEAAVGGTPFPRYGDGTQIREFTYVSDIVAANLAAADREVTPGTCLNIAGGAEITLNDLIALVEERGRAGHDRARARAGRRLLPQRRIHRAGVTRSAGNRTSRSATASPPRWSGTTLVVELIPCRKHPRLGGFVSRGRSTTDLEGETFEGFAAEAGIRLQRAFTAAYGTERGAEAVAEALGYAWEHWRRVRRMDNPIGYLYRVGQTRTRPRRTPTALRWDPAGDATGEHLVEPGLLAAVTSLSESQRVAVVLVHGYEWTLREVAELTEVTVSTVQTHVERALAKLRAALEVVDDA